MWTIFEPHHQEVYEGMKSSYKMITNNFVPDTQTFDNITQVREYYNALDIKSNLNMTRMNTYNHNIDVDYDVEIVMFGFSGLCAIAIHDGISDIRTGYSHYQLCTYNDTMHANGILWKEHPVIDPDTRKWTGEMLQIPQAEQPFVKQLYRKAY